MSLLKKAFAKGISQAVLAGRDKRFVFLYHDISEPDAPQYSEHYSTHIGKFSEQIEFLAKHFKMVSLDEIISEDFKGKGRLASVTFDDGFHSVKEQAFPYLSAKGFPSPSFVSSMAIR
jgi:peptidoglycan/xylan/chitin deacetylase (PgdA/CDA1 family)